MYSYEEHISIDFILIFIFFFFCVVLYFFFFTFLFGYCINILSNLLILIGLRYYYSLLSLNKNRPLKEAFLGFGKGLGLSFFFNFGFVGNCILGPVNGMCIFVAVFGMLFCINDFRNLRALLV